MPSNPYAAVFGATGGQATDPQTQQLLDLAKQQGGAISQVAAGIAHPNGDWLSIAQDTLGSAFHGLMDTLAIPSEGIAALMSQGTDNPMSWSDAIKNHVDPAKVLFGAPDPGASFMGKIGDFGIRFVADTLLDPLTWATLGTSSGIFGMSRLSEIPVGANAAKELSLPTTIVKDAAGNDVVQAVKWRTLSKAGQDLKMKVTNNVKAAFLRDAVQQEMHSNTIVGRLHQIATKLTNKSDAEIGQYMTKLDTTGAEYKVAKKMLESRQMLKDSGEVLATDAEKFDAETVIRLQATSDSAEEASNLLAQHTLSARAGDIELHAKELLSKMIESDYGPDGRAIKGLAQAYFDKGGFKYFGQTIISGARIRSMMNLIGEWGPIDRLLGSNTMNAFLTTKNSFQALLSNKWTIEGRVPDSLLALRDKATNLKDAEQARILSTLPALWSRLNIPEGVDKVIASSIMADKPPTAGGDGVAETLWYLLHNPEGNATAARIAAGNYGEGDQGIVNAWKAARAVVGVNKENLIKMHESGVAAFPHRNYMPLLRNDPKKPLMNFAKFKTAKVMNADNREHVKFQQVPDKVTEEGKIIYGYAGALGLKKINLAEERANIIKYLDKEVVSNTTKREALTSQIEDAWGKINEKLHSAILKPSAKLLQSIAPDKLNYEALRDTIREAIPQVDRNRVLKDYVSKAYEEGRRIISDAKLTGEDIRNIRNDLAFGDMDLQSVADGLMAHSSKLAVKAGKEGAEPAAAAAKKNGYDKALEALHNLILENGIKAKKQYIQDAMKDDTQFKDVIANLSEEWTKNPEGIQKSLETVLNKSSDVDALMQDLEDTRRATQEELKGNGLHQLNDNRYLWKDGHGNLYKQVLATAKEVNDNYFHGDQMFTESALKAMVGTSLNVSRKTISTDFFNDAAKKFGSVEGTQPSNFVTVPISGLSESKKGLGDIGKTTAQGSGSAMERASQQLPGGAGDIMRSGDGKALYFHPVVAQALADSMRIASEDPASGLFLKAYDDLTRIWKASVTSVFPMFHGRNMISNVFQNMMDLGYEAVNPANHIMSAQLLIHNNTLEKLTEKMAEGSTEATQQFLELSNKVILTDKGGYKWTVGELNRVIRDNVVAYHPNVVGQMDTLSSSPEMLQRMMSDIYPDTDKWGGAIKNYAGKANPFSLKFKPYQLGQSFGRLHESQSRLVNFLANLKLTGDPVQAAQRSKQFLFDYQNLTHFERNFMRRIIPFYSFSRKNFEMMGKALLTTPGRVDMFRNSFSNVGDVFGGRQLSEQERSLLPQWMRNSVDMVTKRNGNVVSMIRSFGTPFEQPFEAMGNLFGSLNPLITGPTEHAASYSFFYGKPLSSVTDATAFAGPLVPSFIKSFIGYTQYTYTTKDGVSHTRNVALKPQNMNLINSLPLIPRVLSTLKNMQDANLADQQKALRSITGLTPTQMDLAQEQTIETNQLRTQIEDLLSKAGVGYTFQTYSAPSVKNPAPPPVR